MTQAAVMVDYSTAIARLAAADKTGAPSAAALSGVG